MSKPSKGVPLLLIVLEIIALIAFIYVVGRMVIPR